MLKVEFNNISQLSDDEKENAPSNGCGAEYAGYIRVTHNGKTIALESDAMEPEDTEFGRDLSWIMPLLRKVYELDRE